MPIVGVARSFMIGTATRCSLSRGAHYPEQVRIEIEQVNSLKQAKGKRLASGFVQLDVLQRALEALNISGA